MSLKNNIKSLFHSKSQNKYDLNNVELSLTNSIDDSDFVLLKNGTIKKKRKKNSYYEGYLDNKRLNKAMENSNKKIDPVCLLDTPPNTRYNPDTVKIDAKKIKIKSREKNNLKNFKNINNAVVINNTFFNKYKNNYNFGLIQNEPKKIKVLNIKIKDKEKNSGMRIITPAQNSEEMLDKIKNSLDDDNLKVMLNFSYENFLSKESERESKEYSIED